MKNLSKGELTSSEKGLAGRTLEIISRLKETHPDAHCALKHENPLQLLIATILSAQCTDERVNQVTPALFARYPTVADLAGAERAELEHLVHSTGFYRQKARFIQETSRIIVEKHNNQVPDDVKELLPLPGVARKTANVVLGVAFGIAEGIVVDTHVKRLSQRLGLTREKDPLRIERDLMKIVPHHDWIEISHLLIFHGRRLCNARKPDCPNCTLSDLCPSAQLTVS
jgi:endonuclease-3